TSCISFLLNLFTGLPSVNELRQLFTELVHRTACCEQVAAFPLDSVLKCLQSERSAALILFPLLILRRDANTTGTMPVETVV
ncbi:hypothetical protein, partial [Pisciglobus halotolerans]|uniref:hypothetical protein n=1 Tax=Pisciglobus halotolerans TaxID=745365 RepID=UPI001C42EE67